MQTSSTRRALHLLFPDNGRIIINKDENMDIENEKETDFNKKKKKNDYFCVAHSRYFSTSIHKVIKRPENILISHGWEYECPTINLMIYINYLMETSPQKWDGEPFMET